MPDSVSDAAAVFAEPLAAACRIIEQGLAPPEAAVAILGDGKLGLLAAEVLARRKAETGSFGASATSSLTTLIGRHKDKMELCCGTRGRDVEGVDGIGQSHQVLWMLMQWLRSAPAVTHLVFRVRSCMEANILADFKVLNSGARCRLIWENAATAVKGLFPSVLNDLFRSKDNLP